MIYFTRCRSIDASKKTDIEYIISTYSNTNEISLGKMFGDLYKVKLSRDGICVAYSSDDNIFYLLIDDSIDDSKLPRLSVYSYHYNNLKKYLRFKTTNDLLFKI